MQRVQNAVVRLVSGLRPRNHVTSSLRELHWLSTRYRIIFKLCHMMHNAHVGLNARYIRILSLGCEYRILSLGCEYRILALRCEYGILSV